MRCCSDDVETTTARCLVITGADPAFCSGDDVQRIKAGLRRALDPDGDELGRWVAASLAELFRTDDHREGVAAFLERREPRYVGR